MFMQTDNLYAESAKCPSCASNIYYQPEVQGLLCRSCGNIYDPATLEKTGSLGYSIECDYTGDNDISEDDKKRHEIVCNGTHSSGCYRCRSKRDSRGARRGPYDRFGGCAARVYCHSVLHDR